MTVEALIEKTRELPLHEDDAARIVRMLEGGAFLPANEALCSAAALEEAAGNQRRADVIYDLADEVGALH